MNKMVLVALLTAGVLSLAGCGGGGGGSGDTIAVPPDTTPNVFAFTNQNDVAPSTPVSSAAVMIPVLSRRAQSR